MQALQDTFPLVARESALGSLIECFIAGLMELLWITAELSFCSWRWKIWVGAGKMDNVCYVIAIQPVWWDQMDHRVWALPQTGMFTCDL